MVDLSSENPTPRLSSKQWLIVCAVFVAYVLIRFLALKNTTILDDHDSVGLIRQILVFGTFDIAAINRLSADVTPLYPFCSALLSRLGFAAETAGRLCSLIFSGILFWIVFGIGTRLTGFKETAVGLVLLTFSAPLVWLSVSVLTEPPYIALIYLGLWLFLIQHRRPSLRLSSVLGFVFGAAFLARTEGILYAVWMPLLQGGVLLVLRSKAESTLVSPKRYLAWIGIFLLSFAVIAGPQVWRVSHKLGQFGINGRQVWVGLLNASEDRDYLESVYGLDYSPSDINIRYAQDHPEIQKQLSLNMRGSVPTILKRTVRNAEDLLDTRLGALLGPLAIGLFLIGLLVLWISRRWTEVLLIIFWLGFGVVASLIHDVAYRHVALIVPLTLLVAGIGAGHVARSVGRVGVRSLILVAITLLTIVTDLPSLRRNFDADAVDKWSNREYSMGEFDEPVKIVSDIVDRELRRTPNICARKTYFAYFAGGEHFALPYTDYEGLIRYLSLNEVDFLLLRESFVGPYPFIEVFRQGPPEGDFVRLYLNRDSRGQSMALYRFHGRQE